MHITRNKQTIEVVTMSEERRRRWSAEEKATLVRETYELGMNVSLGRETRLSERPPTVDAQPFLSLFGTTRFRGVRFTVAAPLIIFEWTADDWVLFSIKGIL